jgi:hypothetical protein
MRGGEEGDTKAAAIKPIAMKRRTDTANVRIILATDAELLRL